MSASRQADCLILWCRFRDAGAVQDLRDVQHGESTAASERAIEELSSRLRALRGEECARIGRSIVMRFELPELHAALEGAVFALRDSGSFASIGASLGAGDAAIDRAQYLAAHAPPGAILMDAVTSAAAGQAFLLEIPSFPPPELPLAKLVEASAPILKERRAAIARLNSPRLPASLRPLVRSIDELARRDEGALILIHGSTTSGVDRLVQSLNAHLRPTLALELGSIPLGLEPLASLRLALKRAPLSEEREDILRGLIGGDSAPLNELAAALRRALTPKGGDRPSIVFIDPLGGADPESERLVVDSIKESRVMLIARVPSDRELPREVHGRSPDLTLVMPAFGKVEASGFAAAILGLPESDPAANVLASAREAQLGGIFETARAAVLSGELRHDGMRFALGTVASSVTLETPFQLALRHVESLEPAPLKLLEIASIAAPGTSDDAILRAAELDELSAGTIHAAIAQLRNERLLREEALCPSSTTLRAATLHAMAQARRAELHRLVAAALDGADPSPLSLITRATHLRAGGRSSEAAQLLLAGAEYVIGLGSQHSLNRILAKAIEWDPSDSTRRSAFLLARRGQPAHDRTRALIDAFTHDQFERAEGIIDAAITDGLDLEIAAALRAFLETLRGNPLSAQRQLEARPLETRRARWALALTRVFSDRERAIDDFLALLRDARSAQSRDDEEAALLGIALALEAAGSRSERLTQRLNASRIAASNNR